MKLERFFEKFELFAEAPDAVARMREVVLELAVRGKLVHQVPADESAHLLLERIKKTKERLIAERRIKRQAILPVYEEEPPFFIPESWKWTRLGEIGDWGSGSTPPRGNPELYDGGITWLKSGELNDNQSLADSEETVSELALKTCSFRRNAPGDILLAMYGATIGKVAILAGPAVTNQAVCGCTAFDGVLNRYLFIFLLSQRSSFHSASEGGAQPNISKVKIVGFPFPLPPFAEQKRIVAKVDELMALCDQLEAQQQQRQARHAALVQASLARFTQDPTPANLQLLFHPSYTVSPADLRKTILTLAVQGKLVPQDPKDEPAPTSFPGLKPVISESDEKVPQPWMVCRYRELTSLVTSGSRGWKEFYSEKGAVFIRTQNIKTDTLILDDVAFVDLPKSVEGLRTQVEKDDILITITGANVTKAARVEEQIAEAYVSQHIALTRPRWSSMSKWLHLCFISDGAARGQLAELAYGDKPGLNLNNIRELIFPVPPLAEQRRIVAKVEELLALVDELETQLVASRTVAQNLLAALVRELTTTP